PDRVKPVRSTSSGNSYKKIATHHAEGQGVAAGVDVEERLLLDRVALQTGDVAERHLEPAGFVEADLADAAQSVADQAAMAARQPADAVAFGPGQLGGAEDGVPIERVGQRRIRHARLHRCCPPAAGAAVAGPVTPPRPLS